MCRDLWNYGRNVGKVDRDFLIRAMVGRTLESPVVPESKKGADVLRIKNLSTTGAHRIKNCSFSVKAGEILGVAGIEGSGQKALVDAIMGTEKSSGQIELRGHDLGSLSTIKRRNLGIAYIPEDRLREGIWAEESAEKNVVPGRQKEFFRSGMLRQHILRERATVFFRKFDVRLPKLDVPCSTLSGGNQQKLILARELCEKEISLVICHQPTRGVDVGAIEHIHKCLMDIRQQQRSVLLISSDLDELLLLSDRILTLYDGVISLELERKNFDVLKIGEAMTGVQRASLET